MLNVGIVGLGQGQSHLRAFQMIEGSRVVAVCDTDAALAQRVARECDVRHAYTQYEHLLEDDYLPAARAERCESEYAQIDRSWTRLLKAHVRP